MYQFTIQGFNRDINGNRIVKIKPLNGRGFCIQTNDNLPSCHRLQADFNKNLTDCYVCYDEIVSWVNKHGTKSQRKKNRGIKCD